MPFEIRPVVGYDDLKRWVATAASRRYQL